MMNFLLSAPTNDFDISKYFELFKWDMPIGQALLIALIGIGVVFSILVVLVFVLIGFEKFFGMKFWNKNKPQMEEGSVLNAETVEVDDGEEQVIAAITAAISVIYAEENNGAVPAFKVTRIKSVAEKSKIRR